MTKAVAVERRDLNAGGLRRHARVTPRRMLALALVPEDFPRTDAARGCGMNRPTLYDWVHRYNAVDLAGLGDKRGRSGSKPRLSAESK